MTMDTEWGWGVIFPQKQSGAGRRHKEHACDGGTLILAGLLMWEGGFRDKFRYCFCNFLKMS